MEVREWFTIGGIVMSMVVTMMVQSFAFWRWLSNAHTDLREEIQVAKDYARGEIARIDREAALIRTDFSTQLARLPSRETIDTIISTRFGPLEKDVHALVIEMARNGLSTGEKDG